MPLHAFLPITSSLDQLVAAVVLGKSSPLPIKENAVVDQHAWPKELEIEITKEFFLMAKDVQNAVGATVNRPETTPIPVQQRSGELTTGPNEIAILLPIQPRATLDQKTLVTWRDEDRSETRLQQGYLVLIFPNVRYIVSGDVIFVPFFCPLS